MTSEETLAKRLLASCIARDILVATAESCTGGMVAALPSVDAFVAGHSMAAFEELTEVIQHAGRPR